MSGKDKDQFLQEMEKITQLVRASKGLAPEPQDAISNLVNVREPLERSRLPTYTILTQAVYLKLGYYKYGEPAKILDEWANRLLSALISYKGQGRKEWVEAVKRSEAPDQQTFSFGSPPMQREPKKRFWQRGKGEDKGEFKDQ